MIGGKDEHTSFSCENRSQHHNTELGHKSSFQYPMYLLFLILITHDITLL
jgi:hypothetical protein